MIVIPLRFFDMPNALFLEILAWFTQALTSGSWDLRIFCWTLHARYPKNKGWAGQTGKFHGLFLDALFFLFFKWTCEVFWNFDILATFITGYYEDGNLILEPVKIFGPIHKLQPLENQPAGSPKNHPNIEKEHHLPSTWMTLCSTGCTDLSVWKIWTSKESKRSEILCTKKTWFVAMVSSISDHGNWKGWCDATQRFLATPGYFSSTISLKFKSRVWDFVLPGEPKDNISTWNQHQITEDRMELHKDMADIWRHGGELQP